MSTQKDIYAASSENRPPMLNKENYVPWSSRLLWYAKSRPNGKLIHNSIINGPYVRRMIPEPGDPNREVPMNETFHVQTDDELTEKELKQIEADDQAIQTILLGLPEDIYDAVDSYELKAERLAKTQDPLALMVTSNNPYTFPMLHQDQPSFNQNYMQQPMPNPKDITDPTTAMNMTLALMAKAFMLNYSTPTNNNQRISLNPGNANQNPNGNGNLVAARAEGNATGHNGIQLQAEEFDLMAASADLDEIEEVNTNCILMTNLQQASTSDTQTDKAPVYDSDGSAEVHNYEDCCDNEIFNMFSQEEQYTELLEPIPEPHQVPQNDNNVITEVTSVEQSGGTVEQHPANVEETHEIFPIVNQVDARVENFKIQFLKEAAKFVGDFKSLANKADESLAKHKALGLEIEHLLRAVFSHDIMSVVKNTYVGETSNLQTELECIDNTKTRRPQPRRNIKNNRVPSVSKSSQSKNKEVEKVPNTLSASARTKPITVSQPSVITKKGMNSNSNGLSSTGLDNTKTRRPQPRSNTKNDRVPSASKSSRIKNKEIKVEEHHRNLLLSKKNKHSSSACNNSKFDSLDVITKVVCAMCKKCLISVNHDECLINYVNGKKSHGRKHKASVSKNETQQKNQPEIKKPKKVGTRESLATPK
nr:hypothetical protein [Tanacetum cinerariifolium]